MVHIRPYRCGLFPSPTGDMYAQVVAWAEPGTILELSIASVNSKFKSTLLKSRLLDSVQFCWGSTDADYAWAQGDNYGVVTKGSADTKGRWPVRISKLGFDPEGTLWILAGETLTRFDPTGDIRSMLTICNVLAASFENGVHIVRSDSNNLFIESAMETTRLRYEWPLTLKARPSISSWKSPGTIIVSAERQNAPARVEVEVGLIDPSSGHSSSRYSATFASTVGWPGLQWAPLDNSHILILGELDTAGHSQLLLLDTAFGTLEAVSPSELDILSFAINSTGMVAFTACSLVVSSSGVDSELYILKLNEAKEVRALRVSLGVNTFPNWSRLGSKLFFIQAFDLFTSEVRVLQPNRIAGFTVQSPFPSLLSPRRSGTTRQLRLRSRSRNESALIYVQGPHRRFVAGPQNTSFHHALLSLSSSLSRAGVDVVFFNSLGSTGRGRSFRESQTCWMDSTRDAIAEVVQDLLSDGTDRIALLCGSLGALPVLEFLTGTTLAAAVLVAPVYEATIRPLLEWQHLFTPRIQPKGITRLAEEISTPMLIVHGLRDEVSPSAHSSSFVSSRREDAYTHYVTLSEEPHIFRSEQAWGLCVTEAETFLLRQLLLCDVDAVPSPRRRIE